MGLEEESIKLLEMNREIVGRCGPADCSLLHLAEKHVTRNPVIVTIDSRFQQECSSAGIQTVHLQEILASPATGLIF